MLEIVTYNFWSVVSPDSHYLYEVLLEKVDDRKFIVIQKSPSIEIIFEESNSYHFLSLTNIMLKFLRIRQMILDSNLTF